jgi:hypothetical protein
VQAPYKSPERDDPDNAIFNNHVSFVRVRSEHCIGFLKGRFQSLKGLRLTINNREDHIYATQWIMACVAVHNFALLHELKLRAQHTSEYGAPSCDPFITEGIESAGAATAHDDSTAAGRRARLAAGKQKRNELKHYLLSALHARRSRLGYE